MKLVRIGPPGAEFPGVLIDDSRYVDLSDVVADYDEKFFAGGGAETIRKVVAERTAGGLVRELAGQRLGAPIARPHQILCVGLNYREYVTEAGHPNPDEPILFSKSPNSISGPDDPVRMPRGSGKLDWEVEFALVIGRRSSYLPDTHTAREAIAGWLIVNDVSERSFQLERGGQWLKGKSAETFCPAGPWLVTPDEIDDVMRLDLQLDVNGVARQRGTTASMIFDPYELVRHISQFLVLEPGDLIATGTPLGVGTGFDPPVWLRPGDVMELGIQGLGRQRQEVVTADAPLAIYSNH